MSVWEEIVDYTVPSNTTSVVLDNFGTITKDDFIKVHFTHTNPASNATIRILPNNTIDSNYHWQYVIGNGSTVAAERANINRLTRTTSGQSSSYFGYFKLSENDRFNQWGNEYFRNDSSLWQLLSVMTSSGATFANGITSITLQSGVTNGLGAGSRIQIYRLAAEKVAEVDITGLDIQKGSEYLLVSDNLTAVQSSAIRLFPNDLTTNSQYYTQRVGAVGTNLIPVRDNLNYIHGGQVSGTRQLSYVHIKLSNIGAYTYQAYTVNRYGSSNIGVYNNFVSSTYENLTSISKLNIISSFSNAIGSGTRFQLYKLY